mmetsp:Transcript_29467/g.64771  ORF Transcript_29467/g.64771 Transcript_29467/m.64771 type:complete len:205 (+) Transcript_29467:489-1103(+)
MIANVVHERQKRFEPSVCYKCAALDPLWIQEQSVRNSRFFAEGFDQLLHDFIHIRIFITTRELLHNLVCQSHQLLSCNPPAVCRNQLHHANLAFYLLHLGFTLRVLRQLCGMRQRDFRLHVKLRPCVASPGDLDSLLVSFELVGSYVVLQAGEGDSLARFLCALFCLSKWPCDLHRQIAESMNLPNAVLFDGKFEVGRFLGHGC